MSTRKLRLAGDGSLFPARSRARTRNVCRPSESREYRFGDLHAAHGLLSNLHWKVEPGSLARKRKVAFRDAVFPAGPDAIVVWGAAVSGGGVDVVAVQATSWLVQLGKPTSRRESVPCAFWGAGKEPLKRRPEVEVDLKASSTIGKAPVEVLSTVPQVVVTPATANRVTLVPSAETSNWTVPPEAAVPL